jgi:murein DD-endopeptidase
VRLLSQSICHGCSVVLVFAARLGAQIPSSIEFRVPKPPTVVVNDTGGILGYELHVTNLTNAPVKLTRVEVLDSDGATVGSLADSALIRAVARPGLPARAPEPLSIGAGLRAIVYFWLRVDSNHPPAQVHHRLLITRGAADSIKETLEGSPVPVTPRAVEISPPFGGQWAALNGPSNASGHRRLVLALNGADASAQRFAIDYLKVDSTWKSYSGDRTKNSSYYAYGTEIHSVADGIVVETKDSIPENVPGALPPVSLVTVGGNHIVVDIGNQKFAFYAHLQPGSLRVKVGDHVRRGQVLALLGNSGNSTEPHLHFHVSDALAPGTTTLGSEGVPYAFPELQLVGHCTLTTTIACTRTPPVTVRKGMPMQNQLVDLGPTPR